MRVLVVDNYDSFTYNLVQYLGELGAEVEVVRSDVDALLDREPDRVVVSPGPCTPDEAGLSMRAVRSFGERGTRVLGVCLGHQALAQEFGGRVVSGEPVHGRTAEVDASHHEPAAPTARHCESTRGATAKETRPALVVRTRRFTVQAPAPSLRWMR